MKNNQQIFNIKNHRQLCLMKGNVSNIYYIVDKDNLSVTNLNS